VPDTIWSGTAVIQRLRAALTVSVIPAVERGAGDTEFVQVRLAGRCDCSTSWMISAFSDAGYLMPRPPHPRSCFFKQAVLQGEIGHDLLQGSGLTTKIFHFAGRCG